MNKYPEHEKLSKVKHTSQAIGEFLDWLENEKGAAVCVLVRQNRHQHLYLPLQNNTEQLLAEYFDIDLKKLEEERRQIVDEMKKFSQDVKCAIKNGQEAIKGIEQAAGIEPEGVRQDEREEPVAIRPG